MSEKLDPRVVRTRQLLRDALLTLIRRKGYNATTVQDLTDHATLNRSTFYMHYDDKDDLFQQVIQNVLDDLKRITPATNTPMTMQGIRAIYVRLFEHVRDHHDFYVLMLGNQSVAPFTQQMQDHLQQLVTDLIQPYPADQTHTDPALYASFVSSAFLGVVRWWVTAAPDQPPGDVATQFMRLTLGGMVKDFNLDAEALFD